MTEYSLPYGRSKITVTLPDSVDQQLILPAYTAAAPEPLVVVREAIDHPLGFNWNIGPTATVAVAVNDKTRPVPNHLLLTPLLAKLASFGIPDEQIHIWIASGTHIPMQPEEFIAILPPEIIARYRIAAHNADDAENLEYLGQTSAGSPVWVNRRFHAADLRIVVGDIEPHHFAGFSGGYKSAAIGLAGRKTINHNHALLIRPNSWIGIFEENPLRQDIEEIGALMNIDLALNAILNQDKAIVAAFFGRPGLVSRAGIPVSKSVCGTHCERQFDLVIASAGGHPKDINFYQAQKALTHASMFCKPGGALVLVASCPEGTGSRAYEDFMTGLQTPSEVMEKFSSMEFRVGPHKAFQVARLLSEHPIYLLSELQPGLVSRLLMQPISRVEDVVARLIEQAERPLTAAILPHATTTIRRS